MKTFKQFDLPVKHLDGAGEHYVPPKARDPLEIERRQQLAPGVLLVEFQRKGIKIARSILEYVMEEEDTMFATRTLGAAALNTAWYNYARGAQDVMRRKLTLPPLETYGYGLDKPFIIADAVEEMQEAERQADAQVNEAHWNKRVLPTRKKAIGIHLGNSALTLACTPYANAIESSYSPAFHLYLARQGALEILEDSRTLHKQVGSNPTLAQLADTDSPLSVYWRRAANDLAYEALEQAVEATD